MAAEEPLWCLALSPDQPLPLHQADGGPMYAMTVAMLKDLELDLANRRYKEVILCIGGWHLVKQE